MPNMCADCATICTPSKVTYPHPLDDRARKSSRHWRSINYIPGNKYRRAILVGVGLVVLWYLHSCKLIPPHIASDGGVHSKIAFGTERDVSAGSNLLVDRKTINDSDAILERIDIDTDTEIATANRYNTEHVGMDRDHISGGGTSSEDMKLDDGDAAVEKQKNRKNTQSIDIVADKDDIVIDANRPSLINTSQTTYMQSDNIGGAGKSTFSGRVAADISDGQQRVNTLKSFSSRLSQQGSLEGSDVSLKSIQIQTPEVSLQKTNKQQGFQDEFVREPTDEFVPRANDERLSYVLNSAAGVQGLTADTGLSFIPEYSPENVTIDFLFALGVLDKSTALAMPAYDHDTKVKEWAAKALKGDVYPSAHPLLLEPSTIGRGTPNAYLPWIVPPCTGFPDPPPFDAQAVTANSPPSHTSYLIKALNEMGMYYYIDAGTLLGSYRHRGWIPGDKDVDIVIPVRRNLHFVGSNYTCKGLERGPKELPLTEHVKDDSKLCGLTVKRWAEEVFHPLMNIYLQTTGINARVRYDKVAPLKIWTHCLGERFDYDSLPKSVRLKRKCRFLDVDIYLEFNPPAGDGVCTCPWYDGHALCPLNTTQILSQTFGPDFMKPDRNLRDKSTFKKQEAVFEYKQVRDEGIDEYNKFMERRKQLKHRVQRQRRGTQSSPIFKKISMFRVQPPNDTKIRQKILFRRRRTESATEGLARYKPPLTFTEAQRAYKAMNVTFSWMDPDQPRANLRWHLDRLIVAKKQAMFLKESHRAAVKAQIQALTDPGASTPVDPAVLLKKDDTNEGMR